MCSRLIFRSIRHPVPLLIYNRFLSLTQVHSTAATKLKETPSTNLETLSTKTNIEKADETKKSSSSSSDKTVNSSATNVSDLTKVYSEKLHRIVDEISTLSLVEVMDLNELLKKKEEEDEDISARPTSQSVFKVRLIKFDDTKKVPVIKQVKDVVENINLVQAKKLVESIPQVLRDNLSKVDAETMKAKIEAAGGVCVIE
ncbi:unnamed protein product [Rotaria socialis]|uniref:Large ribosomal subunit protein bL12 C-terminal domain-containing protein n=1 Tax=Rotaria socialis TaxID=392032 RepID=A0A818QU95_9BILA|nr:unnamed protein product [Rotaria socialis]CAF3646844.1 unnamed protein product [Rotaria socialis]